MVGGDGCDDLLSAWGLTQAYAHLAEPSNKRHQIHTPSGRVTFPNAGPGESGQ